MPDLVPPMQVAAGTGQAPVGPDWVVELAWTGHRCIAYVEPGGRTRLLSSGNVSMTPAYPELLPELERRSPPGGMILDGTLVARGEEHAPRVARLQRRSARFRPTERQIRRVPVDLQVADLLWLDGHSLVDLPLPRPPHLPRRARLRRRARVDDVADADLGAAVLVEHRGGEGGRGAARPAPGVAVPAGPAVAAVGAGAGAADRAGARRRVDTGRPAQAGPHRQPAGRGAGRARAALRGAGRRERGGAAAGGGAAPAPPGRVAVRARRARGGGPRRDLGRAAGGGARRPHRVHGRRQAAAPALAGHRRRGVGRHPVGAARGPAGRRLPADDHGVARRGWRDGYGLGSRGHRFWRSRTGGAGRGERPGPSTGVVDRQAAAGRGGQAAPLGEVADAAMPADNDANPSGTGSDRVDATAPAVSPPSWRRPGRGSRGRRRTPPAHADAAATRRPRHAADAAAEHPTTPQQPTQPADAAAAADADAAADAAADQTAEPVEARRLEQHFVYNSLNAIASLIRTDPARARELLVGFADLSRATDRPADTPSTLGHELAVVAGLPGAGAGPVRQAPAGRDRRRPGAARRVPVEPLRVLAAVRDAVQRDIEPRAQGGVLSVTARPADGGCVVTVTGGAGEPRVLALTAPRHRLTPCTWRPGEHRPDGRAG